jgi:pimeloyl-ACP methyl ester carboxylesterase
MIEAMRITLGDLRFDALAAGPAGGEPVLLPEFADCWHPNMQALAGAGYCAAAVEHRDYSPGARPFNVTDYAMDRLVADALGFADLLGWTTFHLIAHDWGGMVAWTLAGAHPDRLRSLSVLATLHPVALRTEAAADEAQNRRLDDIRFFRQPPGGIVEAALLANRAARMRAACGRNIPPALVDANAERLSRPCALTATLNWYRAGAEDLAVPADRITTPTIYIWGDQDAALGEGAARRTADCVDATYRFCILQGKSHWLPEQALARSHRCCLIIFVPVRGDYSDESAFHSTLAVAREGIAGAQNPDFLENQ